MPRFTTPVLVLALMFCIFSGATSAQQFDSFRFAGDAPAVASGSVTSITLDETRSQVSFLNVAGLSTVYDIEFTASQIIRSDTTVFMPPIDFEASASSQFNTNTDLSLDAVQFLTGQLVDPENNNATPPPHWFRMTLHNGAWSGAFRIGSRVYSIDRLQANPVVEVRATASDNVNFQATQQVKVSALIDESFAEGNTLSVSPGTGTPGHIAALESIHIMDGLLTDSLNLSTRLEQLIYRNSTELDTAGGTGSWLQSNGGAFGLSDNFATLAFRGADGIQPVTQNNLILQGQSNHYQFDSAYYFGQLIGLPAQFGTLQTPTGPQTIESAHWSELHRDFLDANPLPAGLVSVLSFDAPEIEITEPEEFDEIPDFLLDMEGAESNTDDALNPPLLLSDDSDNQTSAEPFDQIPDFLLDAESEESEEVSTETPATTNQPGLQSDDDAQAESDTDSGGSSGGGTFNPLLFAVLLLTFGASRRQFN